MSAAAGAGLAPAQPRPAPAVAAGAVTQARVARAEWVKLRALRSTWWCGVSAAVLIVGLGAAIAGLGARTTSRRPIPPRPGCRPACWASCSRSW